MAAIIYSILKTTIVTLVGTIVGGIFDSLWAKRKK